MTDHIFLADSSLLFALHSSGKRVIQELSLADGGARAARSLLAKTQKTPDFVTEIGERRVIDLLFTFRCQFAKYIVTRY